MLMFPMSTPPEVTGQLDASVLLISSAGAFVSSLTVVVMTPLVPFDIVSVCVTAMNPAPTGGVSVKLFRHSEVKQTLVIRGGNCFARKRHGDVGYGL